jgi:hypothetical protein
MHRRRLWRLKGGVRCGGQKKWIEVKGEQKRIAPTGLLQSTPAGRAGGLAAPCDLCVRLFCESEWLGSAQLACERGHVQETNATASEEHVERQSKTRAHGFGCLDIWEAGKQVLE